MSKLGTYIYFVNCIGGDDKNTFKVILLIGIFFSSVNPVSGVLKHVLGRSVTLEGEM